MKQSFQISSDTKQNEWQNGVWYRSEVCFDMVKVIKGSHLVESKVPFLKGTKNAAGISPFFYGGCVWHVDTNVS